MLTKPRQNPEASLSKSGSKLLGSLKKPPEHLAHVARIEAWTRARFKLAEDAVVLVTEIACSLPGCPPLETVVAFWTGEGTRYRFKLFKPVSEVVEDDLPIWWLLPTLIDDGTSADCC